MSSNKNKNVNQSTEIKSSFGETLLKLTPKEIDEEYEDINKCKDLLDEGLSEKISYFGSESLLDKIIFYHLSKENELNSIDNYYQNIVSNVEKTILQLIPAFKKNITGPRVNSLFVLRELAQNKRLSSVDKKKIKEKHIEKIGLSQNN